MKTSLKTSGNGWELYLTKPIIKILGYDIKNTKVLITAIDNVLYFEPVKIQDEENYKEFMLRKIHKSGCGYGIYIPLPLLEIMGVNPEVDFVDMVINLEKFTLKKWVE